MKTYVARAMQISYLDPDQLDRLHKLEKVAGYLIPNCSLQDMFHIPMIRDHYALPVDNELLAHHGIRIEQELKSKGFLRIGTYVEGSMEWTHAFDKIVNQRSGEIVWDYAGPRKDRRSLLKAVESTF